MVRERVRVRVRSNVSLPVFSAIFIKKTGMGTFDRTRTRTRTRCGSANFTSPTPSANNILFPDLLGNTSQSHDVIHPI